MQPKKGDLFEIVKSYIDQIIKEVPSGLKCLILDDQTLKIVSLVISNSDILKKDIYLIDKIENLKKQQNSKAMKSILIVSGTDSNLSLLYEEFKDPNFLNYHLNFTNALTKSQIEKLAEADQQNQILSLKEAYMDFLPFNQDLFSLNIQTLSKADTTPPYQYNEKQKLTFNRMFEGLLSVIYSLKCIPMIKYLDDNSICQQLAQKIEQKLLEVHHSMRFEKDQKMILMITHRKEDPLTPLLNQWTYTAMLHELIGIYDNVVDINSGNQKSKDNEYVLSSHADQFYRENQIKDFGELAENINAFIQEAADKKKRSIKTNTLQDMADAIDKIPELNKIAGNVSKHVNLSCKITSLVNERKLMDVSKVEQDISSKDELKSQQKQLWEIIKSEDIKGFDKLKLLFIFAIRYENKQTDIQEMQQELLQRHPELSNSKVDLSSLLNKLYKYGGLQQRKGDLFSQQGVKKLSNFIKKFKDVPNVFTQHEPYITSVLEMLMKQKENKDYKTCSINNFSCNIYIIENAQQAVLFIVGGATYEEHKVINQKNRNGGMIILGSSYVYNSRQFLAEVDNY